MISCIITGYKEPRTISQAIRQMIKASFKAGLKTDKEIIVLAPDEETLAEARSWESNRPELNIRVIKDPGKGKPCALNIAFKEAKGDILILSDGDVYVNQYAVRELLKRMEDPSVGACSGHPKSIESKDNMFGYWSHLLTDIADKTRKESRGFVCSGYLYALRAGIIKELPGDCLSDDAYISYQVLNKGYGISYAPGAQVFVKYPSNFKDWMAQKKRSTGGYTQLTAQYGLVHRKEMRSVGQEILGLWDVIKYANTPREFGWTLALIIARAWMWANIFWERKIIHKDFNKTWVRIGSTK